MKATIRTSAEAAAIHYALEGVEPPRPLTHDLFVTVLGQLGASLREVVVTEVREQRPRIVMTNNFAFGGINTSILLGPAPGGDASQA